MELPKVKQIDIRQIFERQAKRKLTDKDIPVYKPILVGLPKPIAGNLQDK